MDFFLGNFNLVNKPDIYNFLDKYNIKEKLKRQKRNNKNKEQNKKTGLDRVEDGKPKSFLQALMKKSDVSGISSPLKVVAGSVEDTKRKEWRRKNPDKEMLTDAEVDLDMKREYWGLKILKLGGNPDLDLVNSLIQQPKLWDDLKRSLIEDYGRIAVGSYGFDDRQELGMDKEARRAVDQVERWVNNKQKIVKVIPQDLRFPNANPMILTKQRIIVLFQLALDSEVHGNIGIVRLYKKYISLFLEHVLLWSEEYFHYFSNHPVKTVPMIKFDEKVNLFNTNVLKYNPQPPVMEPPIDPYLSRTTQKKKRKQQAIRARIREAAENQRVRPNDLPRNINEILKIFENATLAQGYRKTAMFLPFAYHTKLTVQSHCLGLLASIIHHMARRLLTKDVYKKRKVNKSYDPFLHDLEWFIIDDQIPISTYYTREQIEARANEFISHAYAKINAHTACVYLFQKYKKYQIFSNFFKEIKTKCRSPACMSLGPIYRLPSYLSNEAQLRVVCYVLGLKPDNIRKRYRRFKHTAELMNELCPCGDIAKNPGPILTTVSIGLTILSAVKAVHGCVLWTVDSCRAIHELPPDVVFRVDPDGNVHEVGQQLDIVPERDQDRTPVEDDDSIRRVNTPPNDDFSEVVEVDPPNDDGSVRDNTPEQDQDDVFVEQQVIPPVLPIDAYIDLNLRRENAVAIDDQRDETNSVSTMSTNTFIIENVNNAQLQPNQPVVPPMEQDMLQPNYDFPNDMVEIASIGCCWGCGGAPVLTQVEMENAYVRLTDSQDLKVYRPYDYLKKLNEHEVMRIGWWGSWRTMRTATWSGWLNRYVFPFDLLKEPPIPYNIASYRNYSVSVLTEILRARPNSFLAQVALCHLKGATEAITTIMTLEKTTVDNDHIRVVVKAYGINRNFMCCSIDVVYDEVILRKLAYVGLDAFRGTDARANQNRVMAAQGEWRDLLGALEDIDYAERNRALSYCHILARLNEHTFKVGEW